MKPSYPIVVFSHLRWDFVYQRPQHLLSRLAADHKIYFIEEPIYEENAAPRLEASTPADGVTVYRPFLPVGGYGFSDEQLPLVSTLVQQLIADEDLRDYSYVVWLYTPMALPVAKQLAPMAVVYDCMDELSAFKSAPAELMEREAALLQWADVVFTGGPSLYRAKEGKHDNLHCFPSSVDAAHFATALAISEAPQQAALPHPRLGFFGVVDERMDVEILDAQAQAHPDWQIVIVGPVVKIDPATLPSHPNLHFVGPSSYADLPSYLAGWDVCLLPFALNESTRFISPTKTLEYLAADKPIVSTPITDVAEPYEGIVYLGRTPEEFIAACEQALSASDEERAARSEKGRQVLARTSWDQTAASIESLIDEAVEKNMALKHETKQEDASACYTHA
jgi:UDP-galactopyranose mutase